MDIHRLPLKDLYLIHKSPHIDSRGSFARLFCTDILHDLLDNRNIVQINHSSTAQVGSIRGLHYQLPPHSEMKFVQCLKGKVWDVAVDLRKNSATFTQWYATELSPENHNILCIPEGFAHGFQVIEPNSELLYFHTNFYQPSHEGGIRYNDPDLEIDWPLESHTVSQRDQNLPYMSDGFEGLEI